MTELDDVGNVVYTNGVKDEKLTAQLTEAMKESWLDRSIDAVAQFLYIVGNVVQTTLSIVTTAGVALTVDGINGLTTNNFASKGGSSEQRSLKTIKGNKSANEQAKKNGYDDAHDFKKTFVGKDDISKFDMLYDTVIGQILLKSKRRNILIETGHYFIH
ncbi:hypothetical protein JZO78_11590 [Enterococcus ureilyticus]|uniref:hypothetical protein n=1 Tax=Enterococcus ureilyticus TaxID=1131292 RepID=UPI001A914FAC|nr:hypothetical protein [Enterococcus ureilyticus]MBO0446988.1 hypothetical protein [Enterococcus ureilyticus]